jgi:hypothetical protein
MIFNAVNRRSVIDPGATAGIKARAVRDADRRWRSLLTDARTSIVTNDCFGISIMSSAVGTLQAIPLRDFAFETDARKIDLFIEWLRRQEELGILEMVSGRGIVATEQPWVNTYIDTAYQRSIRLAGERLAAAGVPVAGFDSEMGRIATMNQPVHVDQLAQIYARAFDELKTVASIVETSSRQAVADGLSGGIARGFAEGKNSRVITRELYRDVESGVQRLGMVKTRRIVRTEIQYAHASANTIEYQRANEMMRGMGAKVVVDILLNSSACEVCVGIWEEGPYESDIALGLIPAHPNCACGTAPRVVYQNEDGSWPSLEPIYVDGTPKTQAEAKEKRLAREKLERERREKREEREQRRADRDRRARQVAA